MAFQIVQEAVKLCIKASGQHRSADFQRGKALLQVLCGESVKFIELGDGAAPAGFVFRRPGIFGAVGPPFVVVHDNMLTDHGPFFKIFWRKRIVFFYPVLNFRAKAIKDFGSAV